jgi:hypothetical protein
MAMARISLESAGSGKSAPSGGSSKSTKSSSSGGGGGGGGALASMDKAQKIKLAAAVVLLIIGAFLTVWHLGLINFSSGTAQPTAADLFQGGKAPTPEEAERNAVIEKKQNDEIERTKAKFGSQGA